MSESKIQNAGSTNQHMITLLDILRRKVKLEPGSTLFCNCDGAAKQYRCANALYYLSLLASKYNISIDRAICAPGNEKDVVDGLNAVDKHYLKQVMRRTKTPQETNDDIKLLQGSKKTKGKEPTYVIPRPRRILREAAKLRGFRQ